MLLRRTEKSKAGRSVKFRTLLIFGILCAIVLGSVDYAIPDRTVISRQDIVKNVSSDADKVTAQVVQPYEDCGATAKLLGVIPSKNIKIKVSDNLKLVPSGDVFGVKFFTKGVIIVGMSEVESYDGIISPAGRAGLRKADIITNVNGTEINTAEDLKSIIEECSGKELTIDFTRDGKAYKTKLLPLMSLADKKYKTGLWVRDSTAGIGTITFYNPSNNSFAGLGHGICDSDTETLMPLLRGVIVDVNLTDVIKGRDGRPGELKGDFGTLKRGSLIGNTECGVYGVMDVKINSISEALPVGTREDMTEGPAEIYCNVDGNGIEKYAVNIVKIYTGEENTKNFILEVNDEKLLSKTGGIVQGMSGSPVIQNGKLVGAVTHVLVNNPKRGYGIFVENMLCEMPYLMKQ